MKAGRESLLDCLWREAGFLYLSDLRLTPQGRQALVPLVRRHAADEFSTEQWLAALTYLTGSCPVAQGNAETLRRELLRRLK